MALQLYVGAAGSGKSYELYRHIIDESIKHPELNYIILVPEQYTLSTQYKLVSMHPRNGILNIDILSFNRLAYRVFEEVGYNEAKGVVIDDIAKNLILRHIAEANEDKFTALNGIFNRLGYISEVKSVISEFMQYGIRDEQLELLLNYSSERGILKGKLADIRFLYSEFLKYINEKYVTSEEILTKVSNVIDKSALMKRSVIVLDGYTGFTPVQYECIRALLLNCVDVYVTILLDNGNNKLALPISSVSEQELFYMSKVTVNKLYNVCKDCSVNISEPVVLNNEVSPRFANKDGMLAFLEKNIFKNTTNTYNKAVTDELQLFYATDILEESVEAAVRIEELVRNKGYHYKDIAVVTGDIDNYSNALERAMNRYDIPYFVDRTRPVLLNPLIEFIRAVFDILNDNFSYEAVFRFLRSELNEYKREDVDLLENYVLKYGLKGQAAYSTPFIKQTRQVELEELERINIIRQELSEEFNRLIETMGGRDYRKQTVDIYAKALYTFLAEHSLAAKMKRFEKKFLDEGDGARAKEYGKIYEEVMVLLEKMVSLLCDETITLKEFGELLDAGFAEIRTGVIPKSNDYVQIGDITRTRLRDIKALFIVGVNDGIIPAGGVKGGIISDMDREFLAKNEFGLELKPTARMQAYTEKIYLYMLMTKPSEKLYLSYSKVDEKGETLNPSYLIKMLKGMYGGIKEKGANKEIMGRVYSVSSGLYELSGKIQDYYRYADYDELNDYLSLFKILSYKEDNKKLISKELYQCFTYDILSRTDSLGKAVANALYGKELSCSITMLEAYARCAYSHFLKYGLSLRERELFSFEASDMGTIFHETLKNYALLLNENNYTWFDISREEQKRLVEESIVRCINQGEYDVIYGSFRTRYMINRIRRITQRTVDTLTAQLRKGSFIPYDFEFSFYSTNDYNSLNISLSEEEKLHLLGRIDRVDVCQDERNIYVKVIDYKSGNKSFDLAAIYSGIDLQLVVYLNAAMENVYYTMKQDGSDKAVIPAGILYYHIDDPVVETGANADEAEINSEIAKLLKMNGLVNSDASVYRLMDSDFETSSEVIPVKLKKDGDFKSGSSVASTDDFKIMSKYVNKKIKDMGNSILDGKIDINPVAGKNAMNNVCNFCQYSNICGYRGEGFEADAIEEGIEADASKLGYDEIFGLMRNAIDNK